MQSLFSFVGLGEILAISSAITWAVAVIMFRHGGGKLSAFELNLFKNLVGLILLVPTTFVVAGFIPPDYSLLEWGLILLSGYLGIAIADTWYLRALQLLGAGRTGVVASLYSPMVVLLSMIFLGERLSSWQYPGFALVLCGILLVTWKHKKEQISRHDLFLGIGYGAAGVFTMAGGIVMVKDILENYEFFWTVILRLLSGTIGMMLVITWRRRWAFTMNSYRQPQPWFMLTVASIFGTYLSMMLWLAGYRYTTASMASILNETAAIFIVIFAWLFLKETLSLRKMLGIIIAISGVLLLLGV